VYQHRSSDRMRCGYADPVGLAVVSMRRRSSLQTAIRTEHWCLSVLCCVGSDLCDELVTVSDESHRMCVCCVSNCVYVCACVCCVSVCDLETSTNGHLSPQFAYSATQSKYRKAYLQTLQLQSASSSSSLHSAVVSVCG
jgi:hypothetical protein